MRHARILRACRQSRSGSPDRTLTLRLKSVCASVLAALCVNSSLSAQAHPSDAQERIGVSRPGSQRATEHSSLVQAAPGALSSLGQAGQPLWEQVTQIQPVPSARMLHAMAYVPESNGLLLYGGRDVGTAKLGDTWIMSDYWSSTIDSITIGWEQCTGPGPPARWAHAMVYSSSCECVVLFGGWADPGALADTWQWAEGTGWTQIQTATSPPPRYAHRLAYNEASGEILLFGGADELGATLSDLWMYDGSDWRQANVTNGPPPRYLHGMAYDKLRNRLVVYGGTSNSVVLGDTWEYDGVSWVERLRTETPGLRNGHAMSYDKVNRRIVLFGGLHNFAYPSDPTVWEWDGFNWTISEAPYGPIPRSGHAFVYDESKRRTVMYGGWNWTVLGDVWRYGSAPELHGGWIGVVAPQCDIEGPAQMPPGSSAIFKATCEQPVSWELIENGAGANWCGGLGTDQVCVSAAMP